MSFRCPSCKSPHTHRSKKRGFFEAFLSTLSVLPFRCDTCDARFFRRSAKLKSQPGASISADPFARLQTPRGMPDASLSK